MCPGMCGITVARAISRKNTIFPRTTKINNAKLVLNLKTEWEKHSATKKSRTGDWVWARSSNRLSSSIHFFAYVGFVERKPTVDAELVWHTKVFGRSRRAENKRNPPVRSRRALCKVRGETFSCKKMFKSAANVLTNTSAAKMCKLACLLKASQTFPRRIGSDSKFCVAARIGEGSSWQRFRQFERLA